MSIFNKINDIFRYSNQQINNKEYEEISKEELASIASNLNIENKALKIDLENKINENKILKNNILNNDDDSSKFNKFFHEIKTTFLANENDKNSDNIYLNRFKNFLYSQYLFYGGIEDDDINYLNQVKINQNEDWEGKDIFVFKQNIIERNYNELFKNILISNELNKILDKVSNNNIIFKLSNSNIIGENESVIKPTLNDIISNNDNNNINNLKGVSEKESNTIKEFSQIKNTNPIKSQQNENDYITRMKQTLPKKKKIAENLFNDLLSDDEELSTNKNKKQTKKNNWDEDEDE